MSRGTKLYRHHYFPLVHVLATVPKGGLGDTSEAEASQATSHLNWGQSMLSRLWWALQELLPTGCGSESRRFRHSPRATLTLPEGTLGPGLVGRRTWRRTHLHGRGCRMMQLAVSLSAMRRGR